MRRLAVKQNQPQKPATFSLGRRAETSNLGLRTAGRPLDATTRAGFESQFGHDFAHVRIHTDESAAAAADALGAAAFSVGEHVSFAEGRYAPGTQAGRRLLAHELAHVVQQAPGRSAPHASAAQAEHEADAAAASFRGPVPLSARPVTAHLQPAPPKTSLTRDELRKKLKVIFGHDVKVEVGDKASQTKELEGPAAKRKLPDDWKAWDPGESAPLYDEILGAVEDFVREVGGVPDLGRIVFYDVRYVFDADLNVVADTQAAAEIKRKKGMMFVYSAALFPQTTAVGGTRTTGIPLVSKASTRGRKGIAPVNIAPPAQSQRHTIAHELGHGLERATHSLDEFEQAVGWVDGQRLYDIRAKGVKDALAKPVEPPAAARITKKNWNAATHKEQPMSEYAVTDSTEDFAESTMAWVYEPTVLKARSPARFRFFSEHARLKDWLPKLITPAATPAPTTPADE
jgi:hypothetical protein